MCQIRFDVDPTVLMRKGVNGGAAQSCVTIEINPASLSEEQRGLLADRLHGIDVVELNQVGFDKHIHKCFEPDTGQPVRIKARGVELPHLLAAVRQNDFHLRRKFTSDQEFHEYLQHYRDSI